MRLGYLFLLITALGALPACNEPSNMNGKDGVQDALDTRPNEDLKDAGEDVQDAVKDVGKDLKDAADGD